MFWMFCVAERLYASTSGEGSLSQLMEDKTLTAVQAGALRKLIVTWCPPAEIRKQMEELDKTELQTFDKVLKLEDAKVALIATCQQTSRVQMDMLSGVDFTKIYSHPIVAAAR